MPKRKNAAAVALRKLGTPEGASRAGKASAAALTPEERTERARKAGEARWAKARAQGKGELA